MIKNTDLMEYGVGYATYSFLNASEKELEIAYKNQYRMMAKVQEISNLPMSFDERMTEFDKLIKPKFKTFYNG